MSNKRAKFSNIKSTLQNNKKGWLKSFSSGLSQDHNGNFLPWISYPAISYLQRKLKKTDVIFEYGCGTSTLFYLNKVSYVISLETNKIWFDIIKNKIIEQGFVEINTNNRDLEKFDNIFNYDNGQILLLEDGQNNNNYATVIKDLKQKFDWIIVDSLKRYDCVCGALDCLQRNGTLILDDSQRQSYKKIFEYLEKKGLLKQDFWGIAAGQIKVKNTTFFRYE